MAAAVSIAFAALVGVALWWLFWGSPSARAAALERKRAVIGSPEWAEQKREDAKRAEQIHSAASNLASEKARRDATFTAWAAAVANGAGRASKFGLSPAVSYVLEYGSMRAAFDAIFPPPRTGALAKFSAAVVGGLG